MSTNKKARSLGSMREKSPGIWELRVSLGRDEEGRWVQKSHTFRGQKQDAKRELARLVSAPRPILNSLTFEDVAERWLAQADLSPSTLREYRRLLDKRIIPALGHLPLARLRPGTFRTFYATLDLAPASVRQIHAVCRAALNWAVAMEWLTTNPAAHRGMAPAARQNPVEPPEPDVVAKLVRAAGPELATFIHLSATTGARRGELCGLRWSDIGEDWVSISRSVVEGKGSLTIKEPKTTSSIRRIAMAPGTAAMLEAHRLLMERRAEDAQTELAPGGYLFSDDPDAARPWRPNDVTAAFRSLCRAQKVKVRLHDLRHFAATQLLAGGVDARSVAGRLGHSSPTMTLKVYASWVKAQDQRAAQVLDDLLA